jgi:hypothetical protein
LARPDILDIRKVIQKLGKEDPLSKFQQFIEDFKKK